MALVGTRSAIISLAQRIKHLINNLAFRAFQKLGFYLLRKNCDSPVPDQLDLNKTFQGTYSQLVGVEMNDRYALDLLQNVFPLYVDEFRASFPMHRSSPDQTHFYLINSSFMAIDAHVYYIFIRHFKPKLIIEIGAGNSTLLAASA